MQNKNNSLIITLLIIVILILAYIAFVKPQSEKVNNVWYPEVNQEEEKEVDDPTKTVEPKNDPKVAAIKVILKKMPKSMIYECLYQGKTYFSASSTIMADGPTVIYDINGTMVTSGGGFVMQGPQLFFDIGATCTTMVYHPGYPSSAENGSGMAEVDIYNVN
jgi:hypothetical protein